jgi:hypothetical protein
VNELSPAQERYIGFVKELVIEGLNRVERVLGVDVATTAITIEEVVPAALTAVKTKALKAVWQARHDGYLPERKYTKRSPKAIVVGEVGKEPSARKHHQGRKGQSATGPIMRPVEGVRQAEAHSEKPASPPTSSPKPQIGIGVKPLAPAIAALRECPCVNPTKEDCATIAPSGIHTRGTGAAAQFSRCRFYDVRMAVENKPRRRFNGPAQSTTPAPVVKLDKRGRRLPATFGHLCANGCGNRTSNAYKICKACRAKQAA